MKNIIEMGIESGFEAVIETEAVVETQEFNSQRFISNETYITNNSPSVVVKNEHQKSLDFSAGAGLFIIVSVFFMFFMIPMAALISVALEIDLLPIAMTIMSLIMVAATLFLLLRAIDTSSK